MADPLAPTEVVRRGILFRDLYWDAEEQCVRIGREAFLLRPRDQGELSVFRTALENAGETFARLQRSEVLAEMSVASIRELGLEVEPRSEPPHNPAHAVILGLPTPDRQNPNAPDTIVAIHRAAQLVGICDPRNLRFRSEAPEDLVRRLQERGRIMG